jgi:limonene-1,2-epoxide hydrolase
VTDLPTDPDKLVRSFCDTWSRRDVDELMGYFADDAVYHNIPLEPAVGHQAIRAVVEMFLGMTSSIDFDVHQQLTAGNVVMNERTDNMVVGDKSIALRVAGVFEVVDGKVAAWRDYFDMGQFTGG